MNKICLALNCFWISSNVHAQPANSGPQDVSVFGPAINVAVSSTEETEADVFFADASTPEKKNPLDAAPETIKTMFYEIENDLLDKAIAQWGSEFRQTP